MKHIAWILLLVFSCLLNTGIAQSLKAQQIDLSGSWAFQIDSLDLGAGQKWFSHVLADRITLPGSMTTNGKGNDITVHTPWTGAIEDSTWFRSPEYARYRVAGNIKVPFWLQPVKYYKGAAWYQKNVNIPASWKGKHIRLYIGRAHWETTVWVDSRPAGQQNSLATAHVYDLSALLSTGHHLITVRVDNRIKEINVGVNSHSITDHTQGNWNGMIGKLFLQATSPVYIDDVQLYPDIKRKVVTARIRIINTTGRITNVHVRLSALPDNARAGKPATISKDEKLSKTAMIEVVYPMGKHPLLWSEFQPDLYKMNVSVTAGASGTDTRSLTFGMREFSASGTQFTINGRLTMLRGTLDCAAFPKTGYPPTDTASWMRILRICRSYGLNHIRFHSWCPPEAAFEAADRLGFYFQIECDSWANEGSAIGDGKPIDEYIYDESRRIVKAYGNHPSFCMMDYGNEPGGDNQVKYLTGFVNYWKQRDHRRLYTTGSGWPIIKESEYNSTADPRIQLWGAGLRSVINSQPPRSDYDWRDTIKKWQHPTVSHEIGQWCVYPDFSEIAKYDGVLKAKNFEIFRDKLEEHGMGNLAHDFLYASGRLQVLCYKADIEAALRTPGFGGFQLLGLYDFPGQGTATVGVLNAFWQDKGYVDAKEYSSFCNAVVPLARLPKMVYLNSEQLKIPVEIAQFGPEILKNVTPAWTIKDDKGNTLFKGELAKTTIPFGNGIKLGEIGQSLTSITRPSRLSLTVTVAGHQNSWDIFVYPATLPAAGRDVLVTQVLDQKAIETLNNGGKVLLTPKKGALKDDKGGNIPIGFSSIFWNTAWTHGQPPVTLGILCDPGHPAFSDFPTQAHSNWQWWDAMSHSNPILLDSVANNIQPIVRVIDDWFTARPLGLIFECKAGKGKLLVSGIDLLTGSDKRPEARQLLYSLKNYMDKKSFAPVREVSIEKIAALYK